MKNRDERTAIEINSHMSKAKHAVNIAMVFASDEYCCLICNAYFRKNIYQSDLQVIEDLTKFFKLMGSLNNVSALEEILKSTNNLKKNIDNLHLKKDFQTVLSDDLKNKLRNLHKVKPNKDSRVHDIPGDEYDDFYAKYARDLDTNFARNVERFNGLMQWKLKKNSRILDIGCGFGLFSHIATFNGHRVDSIDIPNASPILKEAQKLLKVKKHEFTVKKNTPLLKFKNKFDVVTAFQIFFNGHTTDKLWDVDEWKYFLMDLHDNVLNDNGFVTLVFNAEHKKLKPILIDGEQVFLGKKSLEEFFKPFFIMMPHMARLDNKMIAVLTKKNIKDACQSNIFIKRSFSIKSA
tara:strand:+ start:109 stop:1155 length:1047 start_codon:yes stop_codon:yes gene_type:complete